jgi:hypothetical protein
MEARGTVLTFRRGHFTENFAVGQGAYCIIDLDADGGWLRGGLLMKIRDSVAS